MGALRNAWRRLTGQSAKALDLDVARNTVIGSLLAGASSSRMRSAAALLKTYEESPWVRRAVSQVANDFAATRWTTYIPKGSPVTRKHIASVLRRTPQHDRARLIKTLFDADLVEENPTHPAVIFIERGNLFHAGVAARRLAEIYLKLTGEVYLIVERGTDGLPETYLPIPATWIEETPTPRSNFFKVSAGTWRQNIPPEDMLWVRDPSPRDPYGRGSGIALSLGDEIQTDEYAARTAKAKFENHAMPSAIIGMEGASPENAARVKQNWEEDHRGTRKIGRPYFTGAKISVAKLDEDLKQSQYLEIREFERNTITQVIGVPPEVLGIFDNSNRASAEMAEINYAKRTLVPDLELFRSMLQVQLLPQYDDGAILDYDSPVPHDKEAHLEKLKAAPDWALTRNQWLQELGREPVDGGDVFFVPLSVVPVEGKAAAGRLVQSLAKHNAAQSPALDVAAVKIAGLIAASSEEHSAPQAPALHLATIKVVDPSEVDPILEHLRPERLTEQLDPEEIELVKEWGTLQLGEVGIEASFDMLSPLVVEHLENFSSTRIQGLVHETTRKNLRKTLVEGTRAGEGIAKLQKRVRKAMTGDIGKMRATRIARTEVLRSSNFARLEGMRQSGIINSKQWLATLDGRTRNEFPVDHMALHNTIQEIGGDFVIGEYSAKYPGDFGQPEMDINCRCTTIPFIPAVGIISDDATLKDLWQKFDKRLTPWESRFDRATRRGFEDQERDILKALNDADKD